MYQLESRADVTTLATAACGGLGLSHVHTQRLGNGADARVRDEPGEADRDERRGATLLGLCRDARRRPRRRRRHSAARGRHRRRARAADDAGIDEGLSIAAARRGRALRQRSTRGRAAGGACPIRSSVLPTRTSRRRSDTTCTRDASLVLVDWMTSGRHAAGERWAFSRYESRLDIRRGSQRIFFDALVLEPTWTPSSSAWAASTCS